MFCSVSVSALFAFAILTPIWHSSPAYAQFNEVGEPPINVKLMVNGNSFAAQLGRPLDVSIEGKKVRIMITKGDERELQLQHLRFRYPDYFKFEVSFKRGTEVPVRWDLEGQDVDVTVFRVSSHELRYQNNRHPFGDWMTEIFGEKIVAGDATVLELGQMRIPGTNYEIPIRFGNINTEISFDVFEVPGHFGNVRYFLLLSGWDGDNPKEELLVRNLLCKSFEVGKEFTKTK